MGHADRGRGRRRWGLGKLCSREHKPSGPGLALPTSRPHSCCAEPHTAWALCAPSPTMTFPFLKRPSRLLPANLCTCAISLFARPFPSSLNSSSCFIHLFMCLFIHSFIQCLFRAVPMAYGSSQARGSNRSWSCWPTPQPQQRRILNPLSEARNQTRNLMVPSQIHLCCTTTELQSSSFKSQKLPLANAEVV